MENLTDDKPKKSIRASLSRYFGLSRNVLALSLVSLLNDSSSEIIYPLLPLFLKITLGASPLAIGAIEGAAESVSSLLKLGIGYASDKFSRRKLPVFLGYGISSILRPFLGFATSWTQVLFLRLADRTGKGIRSAPRDALIADSVAPEKRGVAFGFHRAMDNLGAVLGPLIGFALVWFFAKNQAQPTADEFRNVFLLASIPAILAVFVISFFVRETPPKPKVQIPNSKFQNSTAEVQSPTSTGETRSFDRNFVVFLAAMALFTLSNSSDAFLLLRAQEVGVSTVSIPLLWALHNLSKVIFSLIGGDLSDRLGRKKLIVAGWLFYALVYLGFAYVSNSAGAWALFLLYGVYFGLTEGVEKALVADLVAPEKRGTAYGFYYLAIGITVFPASLLLGFLWTQFDARTAFLVSSGISLVAVLLFLNVKTRKIEIKNI